MSTLSQFGSGVRSIQTGYVSTSSTTYTGVGEQYYYLDVTVSALANITKCFVTFDGAWNGGSSGFVALYSAASIGSAIATTRVINSTTIRIMTSSPYSHVVGRWTLVEYN